LNYGVQCYEGMKAFRTPGNKRIAIFRPDQNALRMQNSASYICIPPVPTEHFLQCVQLAVGLNAEFVPPHETGVAMYVRPLLFGSSAQLGLNPGEEYTFCVYVMATGVYHGVNPIDGLILEEFDRAAPRGTGNAKIGGNYAPVLPWSQKAYAAGYGITLHLDSKTNSEIEEFSTSGFIGVHQAGNSSSSSSNTTNTTTTTTQDENAPIFSLIVPDSKNVIKSITSDSICQIAQQLFGWRVEARRIPYDELATFSEVLAAGTAAALVPLKSLTMKSRGEKFVYLRPDDGADGSGEVKPGLACVRLLDMYRAIQSGKVDDPFGWLMEVKRPEGYVE
jgi:branched-chain amino acid aminotransferase